MPEPVNLLMLEFLTWISSRRRSYAEAMEAWRSTCPRHTVWEDALVDGLIQVESGGTLYQSVVALTPRGLAIFDGNQSHKETQTDPSFGTPPGALSDI